MINNSNNFLGFITGGSLSEGLTMRMNSEIHLDVLKAGKFVCVTTNKNNLNINSSDCANIFFCLITDIKLEVTNPEVILFPPHKDDFLLQSLIETNNTFVTARLKPLLSLSLTKDKLSPVKTLPSHFSHVVSATQKEIIKVFGQEKKDTSDPLFCVGTPIDINAEVCLDLEKLTERSNGVFGKTGTGKTFLTRLLLAGLISKDKAVTLIFDMHSEYGLQARQEKAGSSFVKGLKTLFSNKVALFSLDPASTRRRGGNPDQELFISYDSIAVEDIISLDTELNLHSTAYEAAYLLSAKYKKLWLQTLFDNGQNLKELASEIGAHPESLAALYRKLKAIQRLPFIKPLGSTISGSTTSGSSTLGSPHGNTIDTIETGDTGDKIDQIIEYIDRGISVIIEFGNYTSTFCYLLLANIITRRIHNLYIKKTEKFLGSNNKAEEPKKLLIVIEEAHKFLNTSAARQTTFGIIAREMRKYYVSLMIVDQRPSSIDTEILSQIGTKLIAQLNDEKDIAAVLSGVSGAHELKTVLAGLESKKQALLLGHAVTMPVVIQTREYDEKFYHDISDLVFNKPVQELINELY